MIKILNGPAFVNHLQAELVRIRQEVNEIYRGFVTATFHRILMETPQWAGTAVASWNVSAGAPSYAVDTSMDDAAIIKWLPDHKKGDMIPVQRAVHRNRSEMTKPYDVSVTYYIANASKKVDGAAYIKMLEDNPNGFLRAVNEPGHMVERTANTAASLGTLTPAQEKSMMALRAGQVSNPGIGI